MKLHRITPLLVVLGSIFASCSPAEAPEVTPVPKDTQVLISPLPTTGVADTQVIRDTSTPPPPTTTPSQTPFVLSHLAFAPENDEDIKWLTNLKNNTIGRYLDLAWRPGSNEIAIIGEYGVGILDTTTWELVWVSEYTSDHPQLMFNQDGSLLVIMDGMGYASLVDAEARESIKEIPVEGHFAISPAGDILASTVGGHVHLLDWKDGQEVGLLRTDIDTGPVYDLAFSDDGTYLIAGTDNGELLAWQVEDGKPLYMPKVIIPSEIYSCEVLGAMYGQLTGSLILNCSYPSNDYSKTHYIIDLRQANDRSQVVINRSTTSGGYYLPVINSSRDKLAVFGPAGVEIWGGRGELIDTLDGVQGTGLSFHPDDHDILAVWGDQFIQIWDTGSGTLRSENTEAGSNASVEVLAFNPHPPSRLLGVGRSDGVVEVWDAANQENLFTSTIFQSRITGLAFGQGGNLLVASSLKDGTAVWELQDDLEPLITLESEDEVYHLVLHPDSLRAYTASSSGSIEEWDLEKGELAYRWDTDSQRLTSLGIYPDGSVLAAGDDRGKVYLWDPSQRSLLHEINLGTGDPVDSIVFTLDGTQVIIASGRSLQAWDVQSGKGIRAWKSQHPSNLLLFTPDQCIMALGHDTFVDFLNMGTSSFYTGFDNFGSGVTSLGMSADGYLMAVGGKNGRITLWGVPGALEEPGDFTMIPVRCPAVAPLPTLTATPILSPTSTKTPTPSPTPVSFTRTLYLSSPLMQGEDVLAVQQRLYELGYTEVGSPDGVFGEMTDQAIRHFQEINHLEVDGYVGPATWELLFSAEASGPSG